MTQQVAPVSAQILPPTDCPSWCDGQHLTDETIEPDEPCHGVTLAAGRYTDTHGPLYQLDLQQVDGRIELFLQINTATLTTEMAEVLAAGLLRGAYELDACGSDQKVSLKSFRDRQGRWHEFEPMDPGAPVVDLRDW